MRSCVRCFQGLHGPYAGCTNTTVQVQIRKLHELHAAYGATASIVACKPDSGFLSRHTMPLYGIGWARWVANTENRKIQDAMPGHSFLDGRYYYNPYMIKLDAPPAVIKTVPEH